jgi:hypothetical protein
MIALYFVAHLPGTFKFVLLELPELFFAQVPVALMVLDFRSRPSHGNKRYYKPDSTCQTGPDLQDLPVPVTSRTQLSLAASPASESFKFQLVTLFRSSCLASECNA